MHLGRMLVDCNHSVLTAACRKLCAKLYLKAETQQVDRILEQFARRYWECNPTSLFGSASMKNYSVPCVGSSNSMVADVVHAVAYSLLLLNTDLHVAELTSRMSRGQFVRNTIAAIQMQLQPGSTSDLVGDDWSSVRAGSDVSDVATNMRTIKRSDSMTSWSSVTREAFVSNLKAPSSGQLTTGSTDTSANTTQPQTPFTDSALSVASPTREPKSSDNSVAPMVYDRNWETEMENMLKVGFKICDHSQINQLTHPLLGYLYFCENAADFAAYWQHCACSIFYILPESSWDRVAEPQRPYGIARSFEQP
jgi:PH and SEC7 domain-containing protein